MASLPDAIHHVWPFLTVAEMWKLRVLSKGWKDELAYLEYDKCRDGRDYMVPFPGFPGLLRTPADIQSNSGLFPHQIASVRAMQQAENRSLQFGDLRGGILGDAPGIRQDHHDAGADIFDGRHPTRRTARVLEFRVY